MLPEKVLDHVETKQIPRNCGVFINDKDLLEKTKQLIRKLIGRDGIIVTKENVNDKYNGKINGLWYSHAIVDQENMSDIKKYIFHPDILVCVISDVINQTEIFRPITQITMSDLETSFKKNLEHFLLREPVVNKWGI